MTTGMLWFDSSSASLADKVRRALAYYQKKYGRAADLCLVNPDMLAGKMPADMPDDVTVRPWRSILPGHLWIGIEDEAELMTEEDVPA